LTFHHRDPSEKSFGLCDGKAERRSWKELRAEIAKCDLLCANCHMIEHFENPVGSQLVVVDDGQLGLFDVHLA
jgi:hypothetical protein